MNFATTLYRGGTGNGTSAHLTQVSGGRNVKALCGRRIWASTTPVSTDSGLAHLCVTCARKAV